MDPRRARVPQPCDPDRVATMYGELGNKLVRGDEFSKNWELPELMKLK